MAPPKPVILIDVVLKVMARVFIAALTLAEATLMDCQTSTRVWGRLAGVSPKSVAELKNCALVYVQYSVHVGASEFAWWCQVVSQWMRLVGHSF
ncbi:hypothetical protein HDU98_000323 [Podochytrium sp. JEL0797]|nr:hypothetical protein HDU98_000323 [Podochytrium sp. JEL0797]